LPAQSQIGADAPFIRSYADLLVRTCHHRGAHAIGALCAPNEAHLGFDGTQITDAGMTARVRAEYETVLRASAHQKHVGHDDIRVAARDLLDPRVPGGTITCDAVAHNVDAALQCLTSWLNAPSGNSGAKFTIDVAGAEVARSQLWQWRRHETLLTSDDPDAGTSHVTPDLYRRIRTERVETLRANSHHEPSQIDRAADLLDRLVLSSDFMPFLTLPAYRHLA
jgi:malate synthase